MPTVEIDGSTVDYRWDAPEPGAEARPPLVFLHEGLGSIETPGPRRPIICQSSRR